MNKYVIFFKLISFYFIYLLLLRLSVGRNWNIDLSLLYILSFSDKTVIWVITSVICLLEKSFHLTNFVEEYKRRVRI